MKYRLFILAILLVFSIYISADENFNLDIFYTDDTLGSPIGLPKPLFIGDSMFYDSGDYVYTIQLSDYKTIRIYKGSIFGYSDDSLFLLSREDQTKLYRLDLATRSFEFFRAYDSTSLPFIHYQNSIGFMVYPNSEYSGNYRINIESKTTEKSEFLDSHTYGVARDVSPDRMLLLTDKLAVYDIQNNQIIAQDYPRVNRTIDRASLFITNNLINRYEDQQKETIFEIVNLQKEIVLRYKVESNKAKGTFIYYSPDLTKGFVHLWQPDSNNWSWAIVDTTPIKDWLLDNGYLFKERPATVNDSHVRVRQYANLEAKHIGFLDKGDKVQVLDRSALKRTIDPWGEHYWYQVKRESDGLQGWTFGAFLEMGE